MPLSPMNELFHKAVEAGNVEKMERMINSMDKKGETPLHKATKLGHLKMVKFLIKAGAQIEEKDRLSTKQNEDQKKTEKLRVEMLWDQRVRDKNELANRLSKWSFDPSDTAVSAVI